MKIAHQVLLEIDGEFHVLGVTTNMNTAKVIHNYGVDIFPEGEITIEDIDIAENLDDALEVFETAIEAIADALGVEEEIESRLEVDPITGEVTNTKLSSGPANEEALRQSLEGLVIH